MKHAVIVGHPDLSSFTLSVTKTYEATVRDIGHDCLVRDLYRMDFEPRLALSELSNRPGTAPAEDVAAERRMLQEIDVFAFVYPLWFNSPPAIVKGYIDRVFGLGFGYNLLYQGGQEPLLAGRQLIHLTSSSSRNAWLNEQGAYNALRNLFDDYLGRVCGMQVRPHIHSDSITAGMDERWGRTALEKVETQLRKYFDPDAWKHI